MHINFLRKKNLLTLFSFFLINTISAQIVWENQHNEIYQYLSRMAQKGVINYYDVIKPISRDYIQQKLDELYSIKDQLSPIEKKELLFYRQEYNTHFFTNKYDSSVTHFFKPDDSNRRRSFYAKSHNFYITADPVIEGTMNENNIKSYLHRAIGLSVWGKIDSHIGFQFAAKDVTENRDGSGIDSIAFKTPETGFVILNDSANHRNLNYSQFKASIAYSWKNGSISIGQNSLLWGYGENGLIVLSDKAPIYPYLRFDYHPLPWLRFNYTHAWLNSNIIDSSQTYGYGNNVYGGKRIIYVPKYMASHTITITPKKGLDFSIGESIIYTDRLNIGYLIPFMFFKVFDDNTSNNRILAGSNGQFFFQASARNLIKKMHLYGTLFIDEIRISKIFNRDSSRNQIGFTIGASITDAFVPYLTLIGEYTRVNPFVYNNLNPAQTFTNYGFNMGDWMGNNFDRLILAARYTPFPRVKCYARFQYSRKGATGSVAQQYLQQPQPAFLFGLQNTQTEWYGNISYEWKNNIYIIASASNLLLSNKVNLLNTHYTNFSLGFNYTLE